jgi:drug/metabolite transporter (DMT)-like permease
MLIGRRLKTWGFLAVVNIFWATQYPAYRVVGETVSVAALNFWTFVISVLVLLPALIRDRRRRTALAKPAPGASALSFIWLAGLGIIPPSVILAWGIQHSSASNASILSLTIPVLMVLMGMLMLDERPGRYVLVSLALAVAGTALISWDDVVAGNFSGRMLVGNVAVFMSGAGAAFYNAYCKKLLARHSPVEILVYGYISAIVLCAIISLAVDPIPFYQVGTWSVSAWLAVLVLGAVVWGGAMLLWLWLLNQLELGQISVSVYMLPVFGVLLSAATLGERLGLMQLAGGAIVLLSAYFSSAPPADATAAESSV